MYIRLLTIITLLVGLGFGDVANAQTVDPGTLIRVADSSAVYYVANDGKRYAFPNSKTYDTWYPDFSEVQVVSSLSNYPLGGNISYRPGTRLIKIESDNRVYAVEPGGVLRWVASEEVARALFGNDWNKQIDDVPVIFFSDYTVETTYEDSALTSSEHPLGTVIQYEGSSSRYLVDYKDGVVVKRIIDESAFLGNRFQEQYVRTASADIIYPNGDAVVEHDASLTNLKRGKIVRVAKTTTMPDTSGPVLDSPAVFVDSLADAGGKGTFTSPYNTLNEATSFVSPGVTIYLRGETTGNRTYSEDFIFARSGISGKTISLKPYPGENVVLQSENPIEFSVSYWNISDISFEHKNSVGPLIYIRGNNNIFTNTTFSDGAEEGVVIADSMHDIAFVGSTFNSFNASCVSIQKKTKRITIENSSFSGCGGVDIDFDIGSGTLLQDFARNVVVKNSTFLGADTTALSIQGVDDIKVTGNTFSDYSGTVIKVLVDPRNVGIIGNTIGSSGSGIYVASSSGKTPAFTDIFNNVFYDINGDYVLKFDDVDSLRIVHNTLANSTAPGMIVASGGISSGMIRNNLFYNTGDNLIDVTQNAVKSNNGWYGTSLSTGLTGADDVTAPSTTIDPFINSTAYDFNLKSGGLLIDAAIEIGLTSIDRAGNPRIKGIAPDIGAYEVQ